MSRTASIPSAMLLVSFLLLGLPSLTAAQTQKDNGGNCDCFRTNETSAGYFLNHRFWDWRNVQGATAAPAAITDPLLATTADVTSNFFSSNSFEADWDIQKWNNSDRIDTTGDGGPTVLAINTANNVYIEKSSDNDPSYSSFLTLRTVRMPGFQSISEIDTMEANYHYMSARFMARITGSAGACAGIFTYFDSSGGTDQKAVQEADIEILTRDPRNRVQYTNQPSTVNGNDIPQATMNGTQPDADWSEWNVYRVDWMPKQTTWYVNGQSVATIAFQVPKDPAALLLNMWSDGGVWTGNMSDFDQAYMQIQWIELAFNTSGAFKGSKAKRMEQDQHGADGLLEKRGSSKGCKTVCALDEQVNVTGIPALLYTSGVKAAGHGTRSVWLAWLPVVLAGYTFFSFPALSGLVSSQDEDLDS